MKFSIIIPTYNRSSLILKTINSVLNQTYENFEIIIIDDGSTDNTKQVIDLIDDERVRYYKISNSERGAARNFGAKKAVGDFITFLDSDDLLLKNYLTEANEFIKAKDPTIFFQLFEIRDSENNLLKKAIKSPENISNSLIFEGNIFACQGAFIKREIFYTFLFNEDRDLAGSEDYELWLRMNAKESIKCNPVTTSILIEHDKRSVLNYKTEDLIKRKTLMLKYVFDNETNNQFYSHFKNILYSNAYAYISIHLILSKSKKIGSNYYVKAIIKRPLFFFSKKSFAIIKHLFLN